MSAQSCYHCGLPVPPSADFSVTIDGTVQPMCCIGCQAVATAIVDGGLEKFYQYRSDTSATPVKDRVEQLSFYDLPEIQADFVRIQEEEGTVAAELAISGITCSACAWLIEHHLSRLEAVISVGVNVSSHRCRIVWRPEQIKLSTILADFEEIGYEARPAGDVDAEKQRIRENKTFLLRLGLAGLGMMQAGMVAIALYAGHFSGIDDEWQQLFRWLSMLLAIPVVLYSARPFYSAAWRSLKVRQLVMDVPVAIAITLAFSASVWATLTNTGEVYFDSVAMFTFFLLLGRYLEMRVRHRNDSYAGSMAQLIPPVATRLTRDGQELVPVKSLQVGDLILVRNGETLPSDGEVWRGSSEIVEAILTGEERPVAKHSGDAVSAGTLNMANPLEIRVSATGNKTRLAAILDLVSEAQAVKPRFAAMADKLSGWFVARLLVISVGVTLAWLYIDPSRALWVTLSVLVVTCPCALSLATPAALTVATAELRRRGFLIRKAHVLETLATVSDCIFDKTGTLTQGRMVIDTVIPHGGAGDEDLLRRAAALESGTSHPIAKAFRHIDAPLPEVVGNEIVVGMGVSGTIEGQRHILGKAEFCHRELGIPLETMAVAESGEGLWLFLANEDGLLASIHLVDELRPGARKAVADLAAMNLEVTLLSGDRAATVAAVADSLGIDHWQGGALPEDKLARLRKLQDNGRQVMMVGDGINDVPVLSGANVSVAMGDAVDLTRLHADALLVSGNLDVLADAVAIARKTTVIIRQNLAWALGYNLLALPLAATGHVPPWAAAIGMSASSLIVVANGLRLSRKGISPQPG
ncbi:MAG: heavy metal translocating P-type ATPase [Porticoccaceae bacterium]|nr:heavy metal translocating P-type ATPase [Porticoccaceae bacterium]